MSKLLKALPVLAGVLMASVSFNSVAQQPVDKTIDISAGTQIYLNNERGELEVITHDKSQVRLVGTLDENAEELIFELRGNGVRIEVRTPEQNGWSYNDEKGSELTLYMPSTSPLKVEGVSMDVRASDLQAGTDITLVSGDIKLTNAARDVLLKTVSGDIKASQLAGDVTLETVSGDITDIENAATVAKYQAVSGDVDVQSDTLKRFQLQNVSGDVEMRLPAVDSGDVKNVSGDVDITLGLNDTASLDASSVSGDLNFRLLGEVNATFDLKANAGGDIVNGITDAKADESRWGASSSLDFTAGSGAARVKMSTVSGTIEIRSE